MNKVHNACPKINPQLVELRGNLVLISIVTLLCDNIVTDEKLRNEDLAGLKIYKIRRPASTHLLTIASRRIRPC